MFDFTNAQQPSQGFLKQSGLHQNAELVNIEYVAEATYEAVDIVLSINGASFRERIFAPRQDQVFPRKIWSQGNSREETNEEAYNRSYKTVYFKLLYLAMCYTDEQSAKESIGVFENFKELVDKTVKLIEDNKSKNPKLNILLVWKNSEAKQKSTLIIPDDIKWVESTQFDKEGNILPATLTLTKWMLQNMMIEKFTYKSNESSQSDSAILNSITPNNDELPF